MSKILLINPNKWGRGITHIWIASHSSILKREGHRVELFDSTFYNSWKHNETSVEKEFLNTNYDELVSFSDSNPREDLQNKISTFKPDIIFWSAISSHIHSEGEYVNIQNGYDLVKDLKYPKNSILVTGGLQATSAQNLILEKMPKIDYLIMGESELVLLEIVTNLKNKENSC